MLTTHSHKKTNRGDDNFDDFADVVNRRAKSFVGRKLFTTEPGNLYDRFIRNMAPDHRPAHRCHACRQFLERYGSLVAIGERGDTESVFWGRDPVPEEYADSMRSLRRAVSRADVTGVFYSKDKRWGTPTTGVWHHFGLQSLYPFGHPLLTAEQAMAEKKEEYGMLQRGLAEFRRDNVARAVGLLQTDALYRSEKTLGVAEWFLKLHDAVRNEPSKEKRNNIIWLAVANAPAGFAHVRSTMIGTLLADLEEGLPFEEVTRRFAEKMHPLQYLRPQAAPKAGNIDQAEKIVEKLGVTRSLRRRFANMSDLNFLWRPNDHRPTHEYAKTGGVFAHLREDIIPPNINGGTDTVTWNKFSREVLPHAVSIDCSVPGYGPFISLVTAEDTSAPSIIKWDYEDARNPVTWYFYVGGANAQAFNLRPGEWVRVKGLSLSPAKWSRPFPGETNMAIAILEGARDKIHVQGGGLFPENLRSEFHSIRGTIEAHSNRSPISGRDEADGFGLAYQEGVSNFRLTLRVISDRGVQTTYHIDRWD